MSCLALLTLLLLLRRLLRVNRARRAALRRRRLRAGLLLLGLLAEARRGARAAADHGGRDRAHPGAMHALAGARPWCRRGASGVRHVGRDGARLDGYWRGRGQAVRRALVLLLLLLLRRTVLLLLSLLLRALRVVHAHRAAGARDRACACGGARGSAGAAGARSWAVRVPELIVVLLGVVLRVLSELTGRAHGASGTRTRSWRSGGSGSWWSGRYRRGWGHHTGVSMVLLLLHMLLHEGVLLRSLCPRRRVSVGLGLALRREGVGLCRAHMLALALLRHRRPRTIVLALSVLGLEKLHLLELGRVHALDSTHGLHTSHPATAHRHVVHTHHSAIVHTEREVPRHTTQHAVHTLRLQVHLVSLPLPLHTHAHAVHATVGTALHAHFCAIPSQVHFALLVLHVEYHEFLHRLMSFLRAHLAHLLDLRRSKREVTHARHTSAAAHAHVSSHIGR